MSLTLAAIFWGVITFSLLVVLHEGGHMLTARAFGVKVHEFFIGLPGPSLSFLHKGTRYGVTAIPLGGYVRIAGMEGDPGDPLLEPMLAYVVLKQNVDLQDLGDHFQISDDQISSVMHTLEDWDAVSFDKGTGIWSARYESSLAESPSDLITKAQEHTYLVLSPLKRIAVLCAGVAVNIVCALAVFSLVLTGWGFYKDVGHIDVVKGGPAALAGIKNDAKIISLDGKSVSTFEEIPTLLKENYEIGDTVSLVVLQGDKKIPVNVILAKNPDSGAPYLGISSHLTHVKVNIVQALGQSFGYVGMTLKALAGFFNPQTFAESAAQSTSIVGISVMAAKAAQTSALDYAWLIAAISLSLGIMNILPIPPLDGGKVLLEIIGAVRRKPVSMKVQVGLSLAGFALMFVLVIFLTYNDFTHLLG